MKTKKIAEYPVNRAYTRAFDTENESRVITRPCPEYEVKIGSGKEGAQNKEEPPPIMKHQEDDYAAVFDQEELRVEEEAFTQQGKLKSALEDTLSGDGTKYDQGKARIGLINPSFIWELARVLTYGEAKYPRKNNWLRGMDWHRPFDSLLRHVYAWHQGESYDKESGCHHLAHAAANLMFLFVYEKFQIGNNDIHIQETTPKEPEQA